MIGEKLDLAIAGSSDEKLVELTVRYLQEFAKRGRNSWEDLSKALETVEEKEEIASWIHTIGLDLCQQDE